MKFVDVHMVISVDAPGGGPSSTGWKEEVRRRAIKELTARLEQSNGIEIDIDMEFYLVDADDLDDDDPEFSEDR